MGTRVIGRGSALRLFLAIAAGARDAHNAPVKSPNADTASTAAFNIANDKTPQRRTFSNPTTEDDQRNLYGQGKVMPKDSSGSGANWGTGIASDDPNGVLNPMNSRLDFDGTVAPTDLDRATDAREKGRIGIFGSALAYAGSSPRVTSETIGRDINPLGRGSGMALVGGELNLGRIAPTMPLTTANPGTGSSINNQGCAAGGCGGSTLPPLGNDGRIGALPPNFGVPLPKGDGEVSPPGELPPLKDEPKSKSAEDICYENYNNPDHPDYLDTDALRRCLEKARGMGWGGGGGNGDSSDRYALTKGICIGVPGDVSCADISNPIGRTICKAAGMSFGMPTPQAFCIAACENQGAFSVCAGSTAQCILWCVLPIGLRGLTSKIKALGGEESVARDLYIFIRAVIAAIKAGKSIADVAAEYAARGAYWAAIVDIALIILSFIPRNNWVVFVIQVAVCLGCCAIASANCVSYYRSKSCKLETGETYSWADAKC